MLKSHANIAQRKGSQCLLISYNVQVQHQKLTSQRPNTHKRVHSTPRRLQYQQPLIHFVGVTTHCCHPSFVCQEDRTLPQGPRQPDGSTENATDKIFFEICSRLHWLVWFSKEKQRLTVCLAQWSGKTEVSLVPLGCFFCPFSVTRSISRELGVPQRTWRCAQESEEGEQPQSSMFKA